MAVSRCISCGSAYGSGTCAGCPSVQFATGCTITMTNTPLEAAAKTYRDALENESKARAVVASARQNMERVVDGLNAAQATRQKAQQALLATAAPGYLHP